MKKSTILIVRAALCLKKTKAKRPKLKALMLITTAILCINLPVWAQDHKAVAIIAKEIQIGEPIPNTLWDTPMQFYKNGKPVTETLRQYKGKAIIFDFWATWCSACISHFNFLDGLSKSNKGLEVILVNSIKGTGDTENKILSFCKGHPLSIPIIHQDTVFKAMFPHHLIPHYVWINRQGKVEAITSALLVTAENIKSLITDDNGIAKAKTN